jgi:lysophospholipase L1-like esterase
MDAAKTTNYDVDYAPLTYDAVSESWILAEDGAMIGAGILTPSAANKVALVWQAPKDGKIKIEAADIAKLSAGGDGVTLKMYHGENLIWSAVAADTSPIAFAPVTLNAEEYDGIFFVAESGADETFDTVSWNPKISYILPDATFDCAVYDGGVKVEKLVANKPVTIRLEVAKHITDALAGVAFAALYDANGVLELASSAPYYDGGAINNEVSVNIEMTLPVAIDGRYLKVFLWKENMQPITNAQNPLEARKPVFTVFGDSISGGYTKKDAAFIDAGYLNLQTRLRDGYTFRARPGEAEGFANLDVPQGFNLGPSDNLLLFIQAQETNKLLYRFDYAFVNAGLHDLKTNAFGEQQVPIEEYRENLAGIFTVLQNAGVKAYWISTTKVNDERHNATADPSDGAYCYRYNDDVLAYNAAAAEVCAEYDVPVIDLYSQTADFGYYDYIDHVHYPDATYHAFAEYISARFTAYESDN